jgi:hypothetical protein
LVEQRTENPRVGGSIPPLGTIRKLNQKISHGTNEDPSGAKLTMVSQWHEVLMQAERCYLTLLRQHPQYGFGNG